MAKMTAGQGVTVGPILLGVNAPAHILPLSATVRRVVNMTALVVALAVAHRWGVDGAAQRGLTQRAPLEPG